MAAFKTAVLSEAVDVEYRLADFRLISAQLLAIRDSARAAADDASPLMPLNAPGTLAYIKGVEAMRAQILGDEWVIDRTLGVEAVINHGLGVRIGYQNVDKACDPLFKPMPRSAKGPATERLCTGSLFDFFGVPLETDRDSIPIDEVADPYSDKISTYFVMVGEDGSIELSSPIIKNRRHLEFRERIFIDNPGDIKEPRIESDLEPIIDFDVLVTLKEDD